MPRRRNVMPISRTVTETIPGYRTEECPRCRRWLSSDEGAIAREGFRLGIPWREIADEACGCPSDSALDYVLAP